ncbi:unnamed protein product, partial [Prorocentrum cordatum]
MDLVAGACGGTAGHDPGLHGSASAASACRGRWPYATCAAPTPTATASSSRPCRNAHAFAGGTRSGPASTPTADRQPAPRAPTPASFTAYRAASTRVAVLKWEGTPRQAWGRSRA